jgi:hypothetical protein
MDYDLSGIIDMHIHTQPDVQPRQLDDIQAARQAKDAGMRAILIKSHVVLTADRAAIAEKVVGDIKVFGGLTLNYALGGFNPEAVDTAIKMGAKVIWMPTRSSRNMFIRAGFEGGLSIFQEDGSILMVIHIILEQIKQAGIVLATGHLSVDESIALVNLAKAKNLPKIVITHPEAEFIQMPVSVQKELHTSGVYFERCYVDTTPLMHHATSIEEIGQHIQQVGVESTVLSTDLGQPDNSCPVEGMAIYLNSLAEFGFSES